MADAKLYRAIAPIRTRKAVKPRPSGIAEVGDRLLLTDDEAKVMAGQVVLDEPAHASVPDSESTDDGVPTELVPTSVLDSDSTVDLSPDKPTPAPTPDSESTGALTREQREAELLAIYQPEGPEGRKDWAAIKAIAAERGITDRPERGWDDAIPLILEKEGY